MGLERRYDAALRGQNGAAVESIGRRGEIVDSQGALEPIPGSDLVLTLERASRPPRSRCSTTPSNAARPRNPWGAPSSCSTCVTVQCLPQPARRASIPMFSRRNSRPAAPRWSRIRPIRCSTAPRAWRSRRVRCSRSLPRWRCWRPPDSILSPRCSARVISNARRSCAARSTAAAAWATAKSSLPTRCAKLQRVFLPPRAPPTGLATLGVGGAVRLRSPHGSRFARRARGKPTRCGRRRTGGCLADGRCPAHSRRTRPARSHAASGGALDGRDCQRRLARHASPARACRAGTLRRRNRHLGLEECCRHGESCPLPGRFPA